MIKRKNENKELKKKFVNILMNCGNKQTSEHILTKSLKLLQKSTTKNHISLIQMSIINTTPIFKVNEQSLKKDLSKMKHAVIRIRTDLPDFSDHPEKVYDWENTCYRGAEEQLPHDAPPQIGRAHV